MRKAPLIVEASVTDIRYEERGSLSFAVIGLQVHDHIVGESPDMIEIRRVHVTPELEFLRTGWLPKYTVGERFIATLFPASVGYGTTGLYNGKFVIENNGIRNTDITVDRFKQYIHEVRDHVIETFPEALPRQGTNADRSIQKTGDGIKVSDHECGSGEHHLDGEFNTWDFTWDTDFSPAQMHYNPDNAHIAAPGANDIADLANLAYELWDSDHSFFSFENASPFTTSEGQVNNNTSVILWQEFFNSSTLGEARPFPNTQQRILNCDELGPESNRAVDIILNSDNPVNWHFGENPPADHATGVDFVEFLAHELGHGLGLAHTENTISIMHGYPYGNYSSRSGPVRGQSDGDMAGVVYQHTSPELSGIASHSLVLSRTRDVITIPEFSELDLYADMILYQGVTFNVEEGATINFRDDRDDNVKIIADGDFSIKGTISDRSEINHLGNSGNAIIANNGATIWQVDVTGVDVTVSGSGKTASIRDSRFLNGFHPVEFFNLNRVIFQRNLVDNADGTGLWIGNIEGSSSRITRNTISNSLEGIWFSNLEVEEFYDNVIEDFVEYGISLTNGSDIFLVDYSDEDYGRNRIKAQYYNSTPITVSSNSMAFLGDAWIEGRNSVYNTDFEPWDYFIINNNTSQTVKARYTYWGSSSAPSSSLFGGDGSVDYANHLTIDYTGGSGSPLAKMSGSGNETDSDESRTSEETQPLAFALEVNYPNPFNPATTIPFTMAEAGQVRIEVYDMLGRRVALLADQSYQSGRHQVSWDASAMASGVYLLRMTVDLQEGGQVRQFNRQVMLVK